MIHAPVKILFLYILFTPKLAYKKAAKGLSCKACIFCIFLAGVNISCPNCQSKILFSKFSFFTLDAAFPSLHETKTTVDNANTEAINSELAVAKNQTPIIKPTIFAGDNFVTADNPTGDKHNSPHVCKKYVINNQ